MYAAVSVIHLTAAILMSVCVRALGVGEVKTGGQKRGHRLQLLSRYMHLGGFLRDLRCAPSPLI